MTVITAYLLGLATLPAAAATETIPFGRIHAFEARQPIGWRPFGWWKVRITTAGHSAAEGGQNKMQNTVLPVGNIQDVLRVFETLLPADPRLSAAPAGNDYARSVAESFEVESAVAGSAVEDDESADAGRRRNALRDALVGSGEGYVRAGSKAAALLWFGVRRAGLRIEDASEPHASLRVRRGWLTRSLAVMPIVRAQSIQLGRPFAHHLLGLASLQAHTVLGPVRMQMRGIDLEVARQTFDELAETVVRVQGHDASNRVIREKNA